MDILSLTAVELAKAIREGKTTSVEATQAVLDKIAAGEDTYHCYVTVEREKALKQAEEVQKKIEAGELTGPLAGVPFAIKDNMCTEVTLTTCSSKILENFIPTFSAEAVLNLEKAGAVILGKTNMDEFAFGSSTESSAFGPTCNPRDLGCVPGGSSGGSAAAVAAGMTTVTLGSDTGGSIRQPAAFCGVVGMKPTYGMVSRYGVVAFGSSLDQVGPFGRTVEDVALSMNALAGRDLRDCTSQPWNTDFLMHLHDGVAGKRIGIIPSLTHAEGVSTEVSEAIEAAAANLASAGAELVEVELPNAAAAISAYYVLAPCEAFSNLARFDGVRYGHQCSDPRDLADMSSRSRAEGFGPEVKRRIMLGAYLLSSGVYDKYYYPAQQVRALITQDYKNAFQKVDAVLMPSAPFTAFKFGELSNPTQMYMADMFTVPLNIAGNCGVSVPVGLGRETGRPVGAQLIGPAFADDQLLRIAATLQGFYPELPVSKDFAKGEQR